MESARCPDRERERGAASEEKDISQDISAASRSDRSEKGIKLSLCRRLWPTNRWNPGEESQPALAETQSALRASGIFLSLPANHPPACDPTIHS